MTLALRGNSVANFKRVYALDVVALLLQCHLADSETQEALRAATVRQTMGRSRLSILEAMKTTLRQQLASADRDVLATVLDTWANDRDASCVPSQTSNRGHA